MTLQVQPLYLAEIVAYLPALGITTVLRYASGQGYTTSASATPANTWYDPRITQPIDVTRNMFSGATTQGASQVGVGDLEIANGDGLLDDLMGYGFDGRSITVYRSTVLNPQYPADFTPIFVGTMAQAEFTNDIVRFKVRDLLASLQLPLQANKYGGTNVLPNGLDGVATDLAGKVKPLVYGSVTNIAPPCVNTSKLIYQVNDGAIASVDAVYDKGIQLNVGFPLTARSNPFTAGDVIWTTMFGGAQWVVAGQSSGAGKIATSPDGVTWTSRSVPSGMGIMYASAYVPATVPMYVLGGIGTVGGFPSLATSPTGVTWTTRTLSAVGGFINALGYGNGLAIAGGNHGDIYTSPDGQTWTARTSPFLSTDVIEGFAYGNGVWVAVAFANASPFPKIATSTDGVTWTLGTAPFADSDSPSAVTFAAGQFIAISYAGTLFTSPDGKTWTNRVQASSLGVTSFTDVQYGNGQWLLCGARELATSPDGIAWTATQVAWTDSFRGLAYGSGTSGATWVAVGDNGSIGTTIITGSAYASLADLLDDTKAPAPNTYKVYPAGGYFRLGSSPIGTVTADPSQGANATARTAGQLFTQILTRAGYTSLNWSTSDVTALDVANSAVCGIYVDSDTTPLDVIDQIAGSVGAWWGPDQTSLFRIQQFTAPSGTPVVKLTANDLLKPLAAVTLADPGLGLPVWSVTLRWGQNYTVQTTDLATGVTDARRAVVAQQWRTVVSKDASVQASNLLSPATSEDTLLTTAGDAQTESDRRLALRKLRRSTYELVVPLTSETSPVDLGSVIQLSHPRFALSVVGDDQEGALFRVIDIAPSAKDASILLTVWGGSNPSRNMDGDDGALWVTDDGVYIISAAEN